jgi:hypothetical protein
MDAALDFTKQLSFAQSMAHQNNSIILWKERSFKLAKANCNHGRFQCSYRYLQYWAVLS